MSGRPGLTKLPGAMRCVVCRICFDEGSGHFSSIFDNSCCFNVVPNFFEGAQCAREAFVTLLTAKP